jgi:hypothetical protein
MSRLFYHLFLPLLFLFIIDDAAAQEIETAMGLSPDDIPEITITRNEIYEGNGLWGYIDGGADIYHEYGFIKVILQEIRWGDDSFKVEMYQMSDAGAAFGIFSISRYRCRLSDSIGAYHCITPHHVMAASGPFYLSVSTESASLLSETKAIRIISILTGKTGGACFQVPAPFEYFQDLTSLKCIKGTLGIMNGYPEGSDLFEEYDNYTLYLMPFSTGTGEAVLFCIRFASGSDCEDLNKKLCDPKNEDRFGRIIHLKRPDPFTMWFIDAGSCDPGSIQPFY